MPCGTIVKGIAGFYYVNDGTGKVYECKAKGIFRNRDIKPLAGDRVGFEILDQNEGLGNITEIFPRKNMLIRPAAANVDQAAVFFAFREPKPNLGLLDRFLVSMDIRDIPCIVCFNKADLVSAGEAEALSGAYIKAGYTVRVLSIAEDESIESVRGLLIGRTTVLAGPSGVGKSSFINRLLPDAGAITSDLSEKTRTGKQTTRHTQLFYVCRDTFIIDTPGFSSLLIDEADKDGLKWHFPEFGPYEGHCVFDDCRHLEEPGCAVKAALESGSIDRRRYESYVMMYKDLKDKKMY